MKNETTKNDGGTFAELNKSKPMGPGPGPGLGLASVGELVGAALAQVQPVANDGRGRPMSRGELVEAAYRGEEPDALGVMAVAAADQAAADVELCERLAGLLAARMESNGQLSRVKIKSSAAASKSWPRLSLWPESIRDGAAAAAAAVVGWRNGVLPSPVVAGERMADTVAVVAWRALVASVKADDLGESVDLSSVSESWLVASLEPLAVACVSGVESRSDKASRWLAERGAARRKAQLERRVEDLQSGQTARRRELIARIGAACRRMIGGDSFEAAAAVGFKADSGHTAGDKLATAARRIGLKMQVTLRQRGEFSRRAFFS